MNRIIQRPRWIFLVKSRANLKEFNSKWSPDVCDKKIVGDISICHPHSILEACQSMICQLTFDISFFFFDSELKSWLPFRFWPVFLGGILEIVFYQLRSVNLKMESIKGSGPAKNLWSSECLGKRVCVLMSRVVRQCRNERPKTDLLLFWYFVLWLPRSYCPSS